MMYIGGRRKIPRSSFRVTPMGEAAISSIESPPIIATTVHPIYQLPPTPMPPANSVPPASLSPDIPAWLWYAAAGGIVYYWWFRRKEP